MSEVEIDIKAFEVFLAHAVNIIMLIKYNVKTNRRKVTIIYKKMA